MHKCVLAAHSDVFSAMFQLKSSVENIHSRVKIIDFDSTIVRQMLRYLYSGDFPEELSRENVAELLKIAEKYQLEMLKLASEERLISRFFN